jgi:hypothetical protein
MDMIAVLRAPAACTPHRVRRLLAAAVFVSCSGAVFAQEPAGPLVAQARQRPAPAASPALRDVLREQRMQAEKAQAQQRANEQAAAEQQRKAQGARVADVLYPEPFVAGTAMESRLSEEERRLLRDQVRDVHKAQKLPGAHGRTADKS